MGPLLIGIILLVLAFVVPLPYIVYILLLIGGIIGVVYGLYILFAGAGPNRYSRWR